MVQKYLSVKTVLGRRVISTMKLVSCRKVEVLWLTASHMYHTISSTTSLRAFLSIDLYAFKTADTYYYETRGWEEKAPVPAAPATPLTPELRLKYDKVKRLVSEEQARENMKMDGILPEDIDKFFEG